jgi:hypothetical protein
MLEILVVSTVFQSELQKEREKERGETNVALELIAESVSRDLSAHTLLHESTKLALIVDLDQLLRPVGRVGNVELHLDGGCAVKTETRVECSLELQVSRLWEISLTDAKLIVGSGLTKTALAVLGVIGLA